MTINIKIKGTTILQHQDNNNNITKVDWFQNLKGKYKAKFTQFDAIDFFPLISRFLLEKVNPFSKIYIDTTEIQHLSWL